MDISCVQSKIRHCDVYFECIYGIIEPSVFVEYGEIQYFSEYPKHKILKTSRILFLLKIPAQEMTEFVIALFTVVVFDFEQQHSWLGVTDDVR